MVTEPFVRPVTTPVDASTVATAVLLLLQAPPGVASASVVAAPIHAEDAPVMPAGEPLPTLTDCVTEQLPNE